MNKRIENSKFTLPSIVLIGLIGYLLIIMPTVSAIDDGADRNSLARRMEVRIFGQVNQYRLDNELNTISMDDLISDVAREHSTDMAEGRTSLGHEGFEDRVGLIKQLTGGSGFSENVAYSSGVKDPADHAFNAWITNPLHRKNILGEYSLTGIGINVSPDGSYYFTQIFVR